MLEEKELSRLYALNSYQILDSEPEEEFDEITQVALHVCQTPVAFLSFIDGSRQWFKSKIGINVAEIPKEFSLCRHVIENPDYPLIVTNSNNDQRFKDHPFTKLEMPVAFCISIPIRDKETNTVIGTLCVIDHKPGAINKDQLFSLQFLAKCVVQKLVHRRKSIQQQELIKEVLLLKNAVHSSTDALVVVDPETMQIKSFNEAALIDFGYTRDELLLMKLQDISPNFTKKAWQRQFQQVTQLPDYFGKFETVYKKKNNELIDVEIQLKSFIQAKEKGLLIISATNVTQRNRVQKKLRESEEKFRSLFTYMPNVVMRTSLKGDIELISPASLELLGYTPEELSGKSILSLYQYKEHSDFFTEQLKSQGSIRSFSTQFLCKDGSSKIVSINAQFYNNDIGEMAGIEGVLTDITDMIRAKEEVTQVKDFYESILHSIGADVVVYDEENKYCFINKNAVKDDGLREWLIGKDDIDYCLKRSIDITLATERLKELDSVLQTGQSTQWIEKQTTTSNDAKFYVRVIEPFTAKDHKTYRVGYGMDITQLKTTELELAEKESYLRSLLNAITGAVFQIDKKGYQNTLTYKQENLLSKTIHGVFKSILNYYQTDFRN